NRVETWQELPGVRRFDRVAVLVDGERMRTEETRWEAISNCKTLVRGALEQGIVDATALDVIATKWDLVVREGVVEEAELALASLTAQVGTAASPGSVLEPIRTAARSTYAEVPPGKGLDIVLERWLALPVSTARSEHGERGSRAFAN